MIFTTAYHQPFCRMPIAGFDIATVKLDSIVEEVKSQILRVLSSEAVTNLESVGANARSRMGAS